MIYFSQCLLTPFVGVPTTKSVNSNSWKGLFGLQGLVYEGRPTGRLTPQKLEFARSAAEAVRLPSGTSLLEAVQQVQPSALIGAAAKEGAFSEDIVRALTKVKICTTVRTCKHCLHLVLFCLSCGKDNSLVAAKGGKTTLVLGCDDIWTGEIRGGPATVWLADLARCCVMSILPLDVRGFRWHKS